MIPGMGKDNIYQAIQLLEKQRKVIDSALFALRGVSDKPQKRTLSRKARLAISRAQKKRWAKQRAGKK
jgi:hypothetical protein